MENTIVLKGNGGNLELEIEPDSCWTRCYLAAAQKRLLGADGLSHVVAGLSKALQDDDSILPVGAINSIPVKYAIHLEETHHSLYYGDEESNRLLFWQSDKRQPISLVGIISLSLMQRRLWTEQLTSALDIYRKPALAGH